MYKRVLAAIKGFFTKNKSLKLFYLLLIFLLCYGPSLCSHTKITTPSRDAYQLYVDAQGIETEAELLAWEKKYQEMELEYLKRYGGDEAIQFRTMTENIHNEASKRRDGFRTMEDAEYAAEMALVQKLDDLDAAWNIDIKSEEHAAKTYEMMLNRLVHNHMKLRDAIIVASEYSNKVMAENYTQAQLEHQQSLDKKADDLLVMVNTSREELRRYNLAYKMKFGKSFANELLLNRYLDAFDGRYTRYSHTAGAYGDVVYLAELYNLVCTTDEMKKVDDVKDQIINGYIMAGDNASVINIKDPIEAYRAETNDRIAVINQFNWDSADFKSIDWDGYWDKRNSTPSEKPEESEPESQAATAAPNFDDFDVNALWE